jgi:prepilin-type N-terminal cleavage/methylation domain-containing protein
MCRSCEGARRPAAGGFTLIEVLAALLIAAVALTWLIQSETESVRVYNEGRDIRQATLLASAKLQELIAGVEQSSAGTFEEREEWKWEAIREPVPQGFGLELITVTVTYSAAGTERLLTLEQVAP